MKSRVSIYIILFLFLFGIGTLYARTLSYQGNISGNDGTPVADGIYPITFVLFNSFTDGTILWAETENITVTKGLFSHQLGSLIPFTPEMFYDNDSLYLEIRFDGEVITPRTELTTSPYAILAGGLKVKDSTGTPKLTTDPMDGHLTLYDSSGAIITINPVPGDSAIQLPDDAINVDEIKNEPGIATTINTDLIPLATGEMQDLLKVTIETPDDGYILLHGKCYLLLSGTVGANTAVIQIDESAGGGTHFPYYTLAGLSGYVNSGTNYFPIYVSRIIYKPKGTYTFRLEGRANHPLPAQAQSWDHILTAVYYPTTYYGVEEILAAPPDSPVDQLQQLERRDEKEAPRYKIVRQSINLAK